MTKGASLFHDGPFLDTEDLFRVAVAVIAKEARLKSLLDGFVERLGND